MNNYNILNARYAYPRFPGDIDCPRRTFDSAVAHTLKEISERMDEIIQRVAHMNASGRSIRLESVTNYSSNSHVLIDSWHMVHKLREVPFNKRIHRLRRMVPLDVELLYMSDEYRKYCDLKRDLALGKGNS
jgi:hypothetical protein